MLILYLIFNGICEKVFNFYVEVFGGGKIIFVWLDSNLNNFIMYVSVIFIKYEGCIMGVDIDKFVVIFGMVICVVLLFWEVIEEIFVKFVEGGIFV